ncbi:hypothetical protein BGW41_000891 [Actinomortierella wolfii]|nr:hypothetical protein BGW41_000891 [Actinomortierella wolfii]
MTAHSSANPTGNASGSSSSNNNSGSSSNMTNGSTRHGSNPKSNCHEKSIEQDNGDDYVEDYDEEEEYGSDEYDSYEELAEYYDRKLEIEESWLEWEHSIAVKNRNHDQRRRQQEEAFAGLNGNNSSSSSVTRSRSGLGLSRRSSDSTGVGGDTGSPGSRTEPRTAAEVAAIERLRNLRKSGRPSAAAIVESYSALSWEDKRRARRERLAASKLEYEQGENLICLMPIELLTNIFSYLEPNDLFNASLVCPLFYHVVNADSCWKMAFDKLFGSNIRFSRLDSRSWRAEYFQRTKILRKWDRGRGQNLTHDPNIDTIKHLWMADDESGESWVLAGGVLGTVARWDPSHGKLLTKVQSPRDLFGSVTVMDIDSVVLSADAAGVVKVWDTHKKQAIKSFVAVPPPGAVQTHEIISVLQCNPTSNIIVGTESGRLFVWEIDMTALVASSRSSETGSAGSSAHQSLVQSTVHHHGSPMEGSGSEHNIPARCIELPLPDKRIRYLETHYENGAGLIFVGQEEATIIQIYNANTLELVGYLQSPAHYSAITACAFDPPRTAEKPMIPSAPSKTSHEPVLFATGDAVGNICTWRIPWDLATQPPRDRAMWPKDHSPGKLDELLCIRPTCVLKGHDAEISSLFIDRILVVSGCLQGKVKTWNTMNGEFIRTIHSTRLSYPAPAKVVSCIRVNSQKCRGAISVGGIIKSWDYSGDIITQLKGKQRKAMPKRANQLSVSQKRKVQADIKQSLEETISLRRLEEQARERREQLHRRYNRLERRETESNAPPMTEDELLDYAMMISRDHQTTIDERAIARQMARIHAMEGAANDSAGRTSRWTLQNRASAQSATQLTSNAGEGTSKAASLVEAAATMSDLSSGPTPSDNIEDDEEEELVRRAIELSMTEVGEQSSMYDDEATKFLNSPPSPSENDQTVMVDVDTLASVSEMAQEDQAIVREILKELEQEEAERREHEKTKREQDEWPTLSGSANTISSASVASEDKHAPYGKSSSVPAVSGSTASSNRLSSSSAAEGDTPVPTKKSWSMVAKSSLPPTSGTSPSTLHAIQAAMLENEDEDTQLARILSLSMIEK